MKDWVIAIPSYRRAQTLRDKTLAYLSSCGVGPERISIFVADESERDIYRAVLGNYYHLVVAQPGMRAVRNFIQNYYQEGQLVFNLDDDLIGLFERVSDKEVRPLTALSDIIDQGFNLCQRLRLRLFGINAVLNPFFMKPEVSVNLKYIVGCAWGCINSHDPRLAVTLDDKEDFERTIKFYMLDGGVVRLNWIAPKTRYYKEPGGMQVERTEQRVDQSARYLAKTYPLFCSLNDKKKSGHLELRLRDKRVTVRR